MLANSTDSSNVSSGSWNPKKNYFEPAYDGCLIALCVAIVFINGLVLVLYTCRRPLRTKTNTLLVSLATSDLLMGLCGIPLYITCNAIRRESVCIAQGVMYRFCAVSTMLHIFAVTGERYVCVIHPFQYITIVTGQRVVRVIALTWAISLFVSLIQLSWVLPVGYFLNDNFKVTSSLVYHSVGVTFFFAIPFLIMFMIYYRMFVAIHRQVGQIKRHSINVDANTFHDGQTQLRALVIFVLMLSVFAGCWTTWYIGTFQIYVAFSFIPDNYMDVLDFLRVAVSFINPLMYTFLKHDFREALMSFFKCKMTNVEIALSQSTGVTSQSRNRNSLLGCDTHRL